MDPDKVGFTTQICLKDYLSEINEKNSVVITAKISFPNNKTIDKDVKIICDSSLDK